ncbi:ERBB receptor feedback inhibitor 1 [Colossoma macropomum]|uniref:ERBB receptor feedback inhibitor 1 n=1 Tax=Colossoma macropomum TaxID=42526 RepID=UPI0018656350|nr:ERBB receptor feedback inhibitor 1 [Colossoma macropomum]
MASARPYWDQHHAMNSMYFCFDADSIEHNLKTHQQGSTSAGFDRRMFGSCSSHSPSHQCQSVKAADPAQLLLSSLHSPPEGDQVVPSFQKLSVYEQAPPYSPRRISKPLPPLPDMGDLSSDEAVDSEVEFFSSNSESQLLVSDRTSKPLPFRYGVPGRRSFRGCGQINYAYCDRLQEQEKASVQKSEQAVHRERDNLKQPERPQRKLRRTHSGPAGSFKPPNLRLAGLQHPSHSNPQEKPEVPPRIPIPSRPRKSVDEHDMDQPPEIPPRQPLFYTIPRAPSPKSLPIYVNGVMPPTQSFAPNPKYVSKAQHRQTCEGLPAPRNPCILPIMEDGKKASTTHYFLLPQRPGYLDKFERFFKESGSEAVRSGC